MSHKNLVIKEGALFLSDAHYSHLRPQLLAFIKDIDSKKIIATQLILMGDIFDALFGGVKYTIEQNQELIDLINKISQKIEVIYLEGNHDFNLRKIFPHAKIFSLQNQPVACSYGEKSVLLAHGDIETDLSYKIYAGVIRNEITLAVLKFINFLSFNAILKELDKYLGKKDDCKEFIGFENFITQRVSPKYESEYFIEGHYHQNKAFKVKKMSYINLGAFACNQRYFIVKSGKDDLKIEEKIYSKEI